RHRRTARDVAASDRTILRRLPNVESACHHQRFASRYIAVNSAAMPLYMDIHNLPEGTTAEDIAKAHAKDMETQRKYGVEYHKYWVNESGRKVFCLAHAPSVEAAACVHREAHGLLAEKIIDVEPDVAEVFLGGT